MRHPALAAVSLYALLCGSGSVVSSAWAADQVAASIAVRTGVHDDYDRVVFDFPRKVAYTIKQDGDHATIRFAAAAKPAFDTAGITRLTRAKNFSSSVDASGNLIVGFDVTGSAQVHAFSSGDSIAVDIQANAPKTASVKPETPKAETPKTEAIKSEPAKTDSATPSVASATDAPQKILAETPTKPVTSPSTPALTPPPVKPTIADNKITAVVTNKPASAPVPTPAPVAAVTPVPVSIAPNTSVASAATPASPTSIPLQQMATAPAKPSTPSATPSSTITVGDTPVLTLTLDPHTATRAAVFMRAGYAYIVLSRKLTLAPTDLIVPNGPNHITPEPLDMPKATAYRFVVPVGVDIHASREDTAWKIYLSKQIDDVPISTSFVAQPDFALGARLLLPLPDAPEPIRFTDPVVGDDLILIPLGQNESFSVPRSMADFKVIPAAQGLVIKPLSERVIARNVTDGIEITAEGGLRLSSSADTGTARQSSQSARAAQTGKSIFDFAAWGAKPGEDFTKGRQRLMQTVVDVPETERHRARLELARYYFVHGYGEESLALLNYVAHDVPDLMVHADFLALLAASEVLAHHPEDGLKHLNSPVLGGQPEIDLWRAVADAELRQWKDAEENFASSASILYGYPEPFHSRFSVLAVESALAADKDHEAADWLDRLSTGTHDDSVEPAIRYLYGVLHAKAGRAQSAESAWSMVATMNDRLYKIRAEMALIDLRVATGSLTPAHAADRLEALRFGWRGDDLEVDILHRLAQFYVQAKNVKAGLATMSQVVHLYPNSSLTPDIKIEMSHIFRDIFLGDLSASLSPLDSLTLYQEYRDLMPTGHDGDIVMRNLAERLVEVDLLDQASSLLEDLVKNRLQGDEKSRTSARLAAIRLLDHKPQQAIDALDLVSGNGLPTDIQTERVLLRAKALSELQRDDEALALLQGNAAEPAKLLRADITMHAHRWDEAAKALMELIGPPPAAGTQLTNNQAGWIVNCAIAYSMAGNTAGLDRLAIDYGAAMSGTTQNDTFRVITSPEKTTQLRDITAAQGRIADVDMFQTFLNSYRKSGGDGTVTAPAAKAGTKP